jgi:polar amino acid transport system substrate-binding protein
MSIQLHTSTSAGTSLLVSLFLRTPIDVEKKPQPIPHKVSALPKSLQINDVALLHHSRRTCYFSNRLSLALSLTAREIQAIALGALLHDIGKNSIQQSILNKTSRLTEQEFAIIKEHPVRGEQLLTQIEGCDATLPVVRHHHERWDGQGYPDRQSGENIPLGARIVAIADAFDAMLSQRPYQYARPIVEAIEELYRCAGTQFDPTLVYYFCSKLEREQRIHAN